MFCKTSNSGYQLVSWYHILNKERDMLCYFEVWCSCHSSSVQNISCPADKISYNKHHISQWFSIYKPICAKSSFVYHFLFKYYVSKFLWLTEFKYVCQVWKKALLQVHLFSFYILYTRNCATYVLHVWRFLVYYTCNSYTCTICAEHM